MCFSSNFKKTYSEIPNVTFDDHKLLPTSVVLSLGVKLDKHLTFKNRMNDIYRSASLSVNRIAKLRDYLATRTTERLIHALVSNKFDCCNTLPVCSTKV